jgi:hypothetical protein
MTSHRSNKRVPLLACAALLLGCGGVGAQFTVEKVTISSGGGEFASPGGRFTGVTVIGEAAGGSSEGDGKSAGLGFYAIAGTVKTPGAPELRFDPAVGQTTWFWPVAGGDGWVLQVSTTLGKHPSNWQTIDPALYVDDGTTRAVTLPDSGRRLFYRLFYDDATPPAGP